MYTIAEDGTLQKDGKMCFCMNTDTSCTASCAAFEERAKDRVWLACMSREIIAKPEMTISAKIAALPVVHPPKEVDPLGLETKTKKKGAKK
jgi:hypothetical protein